MNSTTGIEMNEEANEIKWSKEARLSHDGCETRRMEPG